MQLQLEAAKQALQSRERRTKYTEDYCEEDKEEEEEKSPANDRRKETRKTLYASAVSFFFFFLFFLFFFFFLRGEEGDGQLTGLGDRAGEQNHSFETTHIYT